MHSKLLSKLGRYLNSCLSQIRMALAKRRILRSGGSEHEEISRASWDSGVLDPTAFYCRCFRYFWNRLPQSLQDHRGYFSQAGRGFGEDAFHVMWFTIFRELKPQNVLEIGVYRGQTLSLFSLLAKPEDKPCQIFGISPFSTAGDSVTKYSDGVDYLTDVQENFRHFSLPAPVLLKAYSTEPAACELIRSRPWDLIYIDGNHDYAVAKADWESCSRSVRIGGLIVLDDAASGTTYRPPAFATKGWPDVGRVVAEIDREQFGLVLQVGHNLVFERRL